MAIRQKEWVSGGERMWADESCTDLSRPQRILLVGGLTLALAGLLTGEWFALFVSHVLNAELRAIWGRVIEVAGQGQIPELPEALERLREVAAQRARAMSLHSHIGGYGLLVAVLALFTGRSHAGATSLKALDATLILGGALLQVLGMYLPGASIGNVLSAGDLGVPILCVGIALVCIRALGASQGCAAASDSGRLIRAEGSSGLLLLGSLLIWLGLIFGLYVAWRHMTYEQPAATAAFAELFQALRDGATDRAVAAFVEYKRVQTRIDITAASHSHAVSFGILIVIVACVMRSANLSNLAYAVARVLLVAGAFLLPAFVYLAPRYGFTFALFADAAGALVILALLIVLKGLVFNTPKAWGAAR